MSRISVPKTFADLRRATISELRSLAAGAMAPSSLFSYQRHPLGFLFATLFEANELRVRLHVWPGENSNASDAYQIHNHAFTFHSRTVSGTVRHTSYSITTGTPISKHILYQVIYNGEVSTLRKTDSPVEVARAEEHLISAGESYQLSHTAFHDTRAISPEGAATLVVMRRASAANPLVIGPVDGPSDSVFHRVPVDRTAVALVGIRLFGET